MITTRKVRARAITLALAIAVFSADVAAQLAAGPSADPKSTSRDEWLARRETFITLIGVDRRKYNRGEIPNVGDFVRRNLAPLSDAQADRRKRQLIELLSVENRVVRDAQSLSEEYLNYHGDVLAAVAGLADVRSMYALVDAITSGFMAQGTLISFGPPAVAPVAARMTDPDLVVRSSVTFTLSEMLVRSKVIFSDAASRSMIADALRLAAADDSYLIRRRAVEGLARLGDEESLALVRALAATDPYAYDDAERKGRYPVREAAAAALKAAGRR